MESNAAQLTIIERLWAWFEAHQKQTVIWTAAIVVGGAAVGIYVWHQKQVQLDANDALSRVIYQPVTAAQTPPSAKALLSVAADYPGTEAGGRARLLAGGELFAQGKYVEARAQFDRFLHDHPGSPFADQALLGTAKCMEAQGETNSAISTYTDIVQHHPNSNVAPLASYGLAQIYENQGKWRQAEDFYRRLTGADAYRTLALQAGLRLQHLFTEHPAPATPVSAPLTNTPPLSLRKP